ncbi:MAG: hypothetical protein NC489_20570 [Ruminococcus flavefaciens]|nr:hypothetical protein [Ruminococcus flavefaciens]
MENCDGKKDFLKRLFFSVIFVSVLMCIVYLLFPIQFETNDDAGIMALLAGFRTGNPQPGSIFSFYLWGKIVSFFYTLTETVPWYTILFIFLTWCSLIIILKNILKCFLLISIKKWIMAFIYFLLIFLSICLYPIVRIQFTTMAALCGSQMICSILTWRSDDNMRERLFDLILGGIIYLCGFNIRPLVGYVMTAIIVAVSMYKFVKKDIEIQTFLTQIALTFGIVTLTLASNQMYEKDTGLNDFREFYHLERGTFTDYEKIPYEQAENVYQSVGWDETLFNLASKWFFMDEKVTAEAFHEINSQALERRESESILQRIQKAWNLIKNQKIVTKMWEYSIPFILILLFLFYSIKDSHIRWDILGCFSFWIGLLIICFCVAFWGRFLQRIANMALILSYIPFSVQLLLTMQKIFSMNKDKVKKLSYLLGVICLCLSALIGFSQFVNRVDNSEGVKARKQVENYCIENDSNFYIYDYSLSYATDPFLVYPDSKPVNFIFWGGSGAYSPLWYAQLEKNGFKEVYSKDFFNKKIYFIGREIPDEDLISYMDKRYNGCECQITESRNEFIVYRFVLN